MTLSNNPNPFDDENPSRQSRDEGGDLSFPSAPRAYHNRILVDSYLKNCKRGFLGENELITSLKEMEYEDRVSLDLMATGYRGLIRAKLAQFGLRGLEKDLTLRFLHPVVAVGKTRREHHLFVDAVLGGGRCGFVDSDAVGCFQNGPAAIQLSRIAGGDKQPRVVLSRLLSFPAFHEAMNDLIAARWEDVYANPRSFVALGWLMQGLATSRTRDSVSANERSRGFKPLALSSIEGFMWTGSRKPHTFECSLGNAYYVMQVDLDKKTRQPVIYINEERF